MRFKFSPRQKVVSLALAVLVLGVLSILAFRYYGNIFADTATAKTRVTISLTNWSEKEQSTYFKYVDDKQYRCSTIDIYLENAQEGRGPQELVANNKAAIIIAIPKILQATNEKYKLTDSNNKFIVANSITDAIKNTEGWQNISDQEVGEKIKRLVVLDSTGYRCQGTGSVSYDKNFVIPAEYQNNGITATTRNLTESGSDTGSDIGDPISADSPDSGPVCAKNVTDGANVTYEWVDRGLIGADYVEEPDASKCGVQATTSTDTQTQNLLKVGVTVENANGNPVNDALVLFHFFENSTSTNIKSKSNETTNENGYVQAEIDNKTYRYLEIIAEKKGEVAKKERFDISKYPLPGLENFETTITIDITDEQAQASESHANTAATAGDPSPELVAPVGVTIDQNWPGGDNTLKLSALRKSLQASGGYTPVGGVSFDIKVYTTAKKTSYNNPLAAQIAKAQIRDSRKEPTATSPTLSPSKQIGTDFPFDTNRIIPYTSDSADFARNLRKLNQYSLSGVIPDNGINSMVVINNMPDGIYDVTIRKNGFTNSRFLINQDEDQAPQCDAPLTIGAKKGAEPPSINSASIFKIANTDKYVAGEYIYYPKYPWFGWQKENSYITQQPQMLQGVPGLVDTSGQLIGQTATSPELQQCINEKLKSVSVTARNLSTKDILLGGGATYLFKQSEKQNQDWAKGAMIAGGIAALIKLSKESDARYDVNYSEINCAELIYGQNGGVRTGCEGCLRAITGGTGSCNPLCYLQYASVLNTLGGIPISAMWRS